MFTRIALLAAVSLTAQAVCRGADKEAIKVVEKALKAHGGEEAHKKYTSREVTFEGTMITPTEKVKFKSFAGYALPDKSKEMLEFVDRKASVEVIMNGDKFKQTINGKSEELKDEVLKAEYKQNAAIQDVTQLYTLLDAEKYALKSGKDELIGTQDSATVMVTRLGMKELTLNIEKETGRLIRYSFKTRSPFDPKKEILQETLQSDFKTFSGLLLPTTLVIKHDGKEFMTLKVLDVKLLEKPDLKAYKID